jgi:hypothetical protein
MSEIYPTSQHIALYLVKHGVIDDTISKEFGPKVIYLSWNPEKANDLENYHASHLGLKILDPKLLVKYTTKFPRSNPLIPGASKLEIELSHAKNSNLQGLRTCEHALTGVPSDFTIYENEIKEGLDHNLPIRNIIHGDRKLRLEEKKWKQRAYHKFLEYVFQELIKR